MARRREKGTALSRLLLYGCAWRRTPTRDVCRFMSSRWRLPCRRPSLRRSSPRFGIDDAPRRPASILSEISVQLPLAHLPDVLLPLLPFRVEVALVDVVAQRLANDRILLEVVERFVQIPWQVV